MEKSTVTKPHPDALPPDFDDWDDKKPTHPAGDVTAFDEKTGLPIVRRKSAEPERKPEKADEKPQATAAKPAEKPDEPAEKPQETPKPSEKDDTSDKLEKGKPVKLADGRTGKIAYLDPGMRVARVKLDGGGHETVKQKDLKVVPHVQVTAHVRRIAEK